MPEGTDAAAGATCVTNKQLATKRRIPKGRVHTTRRRDLPKETLAGPVGAKLPWSTKTPTLLATV
jgi:hypothetical protein